MLKGSMYITSDINMVDQALYNNCKVVAIVENAESIPSNNVQNIIIGAVLLPPPEAVICELDGDIQSFYNMYYSHLGKKDVDALVCLMITAMARGFNMLLYVPKDDALLFVNAFMQYMQSVYGINIGTESNQYYYDRKFDFVLCTRLYMHSLISIEEYFVSYPMDANIDGSVLPQLINEVGGSIPQFNTEQEYWNFFNDYKNRIKNNNNKFLVFPVRFGGNKKC